MIGGVRLLLRENSADTDLPADFLSIFTHSTSGSEKVKLTLIGSPLRSFQ